MEAGVSKVHSALFESRCSQGWVSQGGYSMREPLTRGWVSRRGMQLYGEPLTRGWVSKVPYLRAAFRGWVSKVFIESRCS